MSERVGNVSVEIKEDVKKAAIVSYPGSDDQILQRILENSTGHQIGSD